MRLGTLAFVFVLAACSSSEEPAPAGAPDTGTTTDGSTPDAASDGSGGSDTSTPSDSGEPGDTGTTTDTAAPADAAGVKCGDDVCPVGEVCCVTSSGGSLSFTCDTSCSDAGGTISCDGPEDCSSSSPICCATVEVSGSFPACEFKAGDAACKSTCNSDLPTSFPSTCLAGATVRACHKKADCGESAYPNCCELSDGTNTATFCVPDYMTALALDCPE